MIGSEAASEPPVSLTFFDPDRRLHGLARRGLTLLFRNASPSAIQGGPDVEARGDGYRATLDDRLELQFAPVAARTPLAGAVVDVCRVTGTVDGERVECLGTASETRSPPAWEELDVLRTVSALFDPEHAALLVARRPRGAPGHGRELVSAALLDGGEVRAVEDARLSTVYDGAGRQQSASLELWMPGEDFPRRAAGELRAGTTLELPGLTVNASVFAWRMEGREGAGAYELTIRDEPAEAA
ncbi:MAG TPA: hypothetical protein VGR10_02790 [Thermoleophilaceae bacterium]|nr:hypothetical protein [Thermoleophilaceae bacterium]